MAVAQITRAAAVTPGRVALTLPELAENGNSVSLTVAVESPMSEADHVRAIHILSGKNPIADIVRFGLGPRSGRAYVRTNVRIADTQTVTALAEMSDGTFWSGTADVLVTISACTDAG